MYQSLQQFIEEIVDSTKLKGKVKNELLRELTSHILEEEKELQLQGCSEEKIIEVIHNRWGNIQTFSQELSIVHTMSQRFYIQLGIILFIVLVSILLIVTRLWGHFLEPLYL